MKFKFLLFFLCLTFFQNSYGQSPFASLTERGPNDVAGRINSILVDTVNGIYLAGTSSGGLWRFVLDKTVQRQSYTNNTQWYKINDFAPSLCISKIVQHPANPNVILYGTGTLDGTPNGYDPAAGIFKSTDGGKTFTQLSASSPKTNSDFNHVYSLAFHPTTHDLYVGLSGNVYISKDTGVTFQKIYSDANSGLIESIFFNASGAVLIGVANRGVFSSPDGSANSFVQLTNGITNTSSGNYYVKISGCNAQRNIIYALISNSGSATGNIDGIFKSTDGGSSWGQVSNPDSTAIFDQPFRAFVISVKPTDPNTVIAAGTAPVVSLDGGTTWARVYNPCVDFASVTWDENNTSVYFTCDQGMFFNLHDTTLDMTKGYGNAAVLVENGLNDLQTYYGDYFTKGNGIVVGAQDNQSRVVLNNSYASSWYVGGDGFTVYTHKQDSNVVYGSYQYGGMYRCDSAYAAYPINYSVSMLDKTLDANGDGNVDEGHQFYTQFLVSSSNSDNLFFPTDVRMYRSTNRGTNWTAISTSSSLNYAVMAFDEQAAIPILYFAVDNNLYRIQNATTTAAVTPETFNLSFNYYEYVNKLEMDPNDYTKLYYITKNEGISGTYLYRIDGANGYSYTKTDISGDMPTFINDIAVYPGNSNIIFAGTLNGLYYTNDGGTTWNLVSNFPYVYVSDIKFRPSDNKLYIFTYGRGAWIADINPSLVTGTTSASPISSLTEDALIYPSPADNYIRVKTGLNTSNEVTIMDLNGRVVKMIDDYANESPIMVQDLQAGMYIVKSEFEGGCNYIKFVKK